MQEAWETVYNPIKHQSAITIAGMDNLLGTAENKAKLKYENSQFLVKL